MTVFVSRHRFHVSVNNKLIIHQKDLRNSSLFIERVGGYRSLEKYNTEKKTN